MSGNRTYSNTMHTRRVYTADGVDLITNGVERETWQNKARIPVDEGSEWELNDGAGTCTWFAAHNASLISSRIRQHKSCIRGR